MIDAGVNLSRYESAADDVLHRAVQAGVKQFIAVGTCLDSSIRSGLLARRHPEIVFCTAGVHPHRANQWVEADAALFRSLWEDSQIVAIGETGLDYYRMLSPAPVQWSVFERHLEEALRCDKPAFLHCRQAHEDFTSILRPFMQQGGRALVHCFTGGPEQVQELLSLGADIGISGWAADERRNATLRLSVPLIPEDRLHLETDAPFLTPRNMPEFRKSACNEPAFLPWVAEAVAALRGVCAKELATCCAKNTRRLFELPDPAVLLN